jgi:hypothetical protein
LQHARTADPAETKVGRLSLAALDARRVVESCRCPLWVDSESGNNLPIFSGMSERALRAEPTVTVECLSCRHVGVLTGAALSRLAIMPDTPIATFVKRLRCSKCGGRSVLEPPARPQRVINVRVRAIRQAAQRNQGRFGHSPSRRLAPNSSIYTLQQAIRCQLPAGSHLVPAIPDHAARRKIRFRKS